MPKRAKYSLPWYSNRSITSNTNDTALNKFVRQSSPAGVSPGLLALDLGCALPKAPPVLPLRLRLLVLTPLWPDHVRPIRTLEATGPTTAPAEAAEGRVPEEGAQPRSRASSPGETPAGD